MDSEGQRAKQRIAKEHAQKLSSSSRGHVCPRCSKPALVRVRRPFYLRVIRALSIDLRTYRCAICGNGTTIRHRG